MSSRPDIRNYVNPQPKGKFTAAWQVEYLPDGETYTEDKSGRVIDVLMKSIRPGAVVRVRRLFCLAPWLGTPRQRRKRMAQLVDAIKEHGGAVLEAETQLRSDVKGQCAQMLMGGYEDIASAGRGLSKGKLGRPAREFSKEQMEAMQRIWFSRRYRTRAEAVAAIQSLGIRVTGPWLYQKFGKPDRAAQTVLEVIQLIPEPPAKPERPRKGKVPSLRKRPSLVYFIRDGDKVKIGHSVKPTVRMAALTTHSKLELLAVCHGGREREASLHQRFSDHRVKGEWFTLTPEILKYIAGLKKPRKSR
jgi:hypothetical protein